MSAVKFAYHLNLDITTERRDAHQLKRYEIESAYDHEMWRDSFDLDFVNNPLSALETLDTRTDLTDEQRTREQALVKETLGRLIRQGSAARGRKARRVVADYVDQSVLFDRGQRKDIAIFIDCLLLTQDILRRMNETQFSDVDIAEMQAFMADVKQDIRHIWGKNVRFVNTSKQRLTREFNYFNDIMADLDGKQPLIDHKALVSYRFKLKAAHGLPHDARTPLFADEVPFWQLPTRLYELRRHFDIMPDDVKRFRLCLDAHAPDLKESFRLSVNGDSTEEMKQGLDELARTRADELARDDLSFSFTLHSLHPDQQEMAMHTPPMSNVKALWEDLHDTLGILRESHGPKAVPQLP